MLPSHLAVLIKLRKNMVQRWCIRLLRILKVKVIIHGDDSTFLNRVDNLLLLRDGNLMSSDLFSVIKIWNTTSWTLIKTIKNTGAFIMVQDLFNDEIIYFLSKIDDYCQTKKMHSI